MSHIVLSEDQTRVLAEATGSVEVRDNQGQLLAFLTPLGPDLAATILECKQRHAAPGPRIPSEQVQAHLRRLEEIRQREGLDRERMLDLLRRMRAGEEV
jgi:hypothetical protein